MKILIKRDEILNAICEKSKKNKQIATFCDFGLQYIGIQQETRDVFFEIKNKEKLFWASIEYGIKFEPINIS